AIDIFFPNFEEGRVLTGCDEPEAIVRALANIYSDALIILKLDADGDLYLMALQQLKSHQRPTTSLTQLAQETHSQAHFLPTI
ncbi:MAG: hypothetical protein ACKO82_06285, partial [Acidimicrobiaceae bacterium]